MNIFKRIAGYIFRLSSFRIGLIITFVVLVLYFAAQLGKPSFLRPLARSGLASVIRQMELKAYDLRFRIRGDVPVGDEVVIVAIDETSIDKLGHWPWPRDQWGKFLTNMKKYEPKVVAFDIVFAEPDQNVNTGYLDQVKQEFINRGLAKADLEGSDVRSKMDSFAQELAEQEKLLGRMLSEMEDSRRKDQKLAAEIKSRLSRIRKLQKDLEKAAGAQKGAEKRFGQFREGLRSFPGFIENLKMQANTDQYFAEALKEMPQAVMGWFFFQSKWEVGQLEDQNFSDEAASLEKSTVKNIRMKKGASWSRLSRKLTRMYGMRVNIPMLSEVAEHFGYFTFISDLEDGVYRKAQLLSCYEVPDGNPPGPENVKIYPLLSVAALKTYLDQEPLVMVDSVGVSGITVGDYDIPVDERGRMYINFRGKTGTFPYYSAYDVISDYKEKPDVDPRELFKDKIVLVGATTIGIYDIRTTPYESMPGIEMHANTIDNILHGQAIVRPSWYGIFDVFFIIFVGLFLGLMLPRLRPVWGVIATLILFLGYAFVNYWLFAERYYSFTILYPLAELVLLYLGITIYHYALEERDKRFIKSAFGYYLSPHVIDELTSNPDKLKLGGERKQVTAFFSDIQGFSTISEKVSPEELVAILNEYLTEMSDIILKYDGTIDKYEGDAIMAFFGAPIDYPDHARKACLATLEQQKRLAELRKTWSEQGKHQLFVRVGLNTGGVVVGNMGSLKRMDYTIMGDEVNLASRLEGANKPYGTYTMASEATYRQAKDAVEARELDLLRVVGKEVPVRVYELLALKGELSPEKDKTVKAFLEGLSFYRERDWQKALSAFEKALGIDPDDGPSKTYIERCNFFLATPPPPNWDGVFALKEK